MTEWWVPATVACSCGEHRARDPQVVLEALEALLERRERVAVGVVLGLEPAGADAVERAAAGDDVERRRDLGVLGRVAVADAADEQAERDRLGPRGEAGEHRVALEHPVLRRADRRDLVVVVHHRDRREARLLGRRRDLDELLEDRLGPDARVVEVRQVQVQLDRSAHTSHGTRRCRSAQRFVYAGASGVAPPPRPRSPPSRRSACRRRARAPARPPGRCSAGSRHGDRAG